MLFNLTAITLWPISFSSKLEEDIRKSGISWQGRPRGFFRKWEKTWEVKREPRKPQRGTSKSMEEKFDLYRVNLLIIKLDEWANNIK